MSAMEYSTAIIVVVIQQFVQNTV